VGKTAGDRVAREKKIRKEGCRERVKMRGR
jgi:hypothetical protein